MIPALRNAVNGTSGSDATNRTLNMTLTTLKSQEAMILNNVRLLKHLAALFVSKNVHYKYLQDELINDGLCFLVEIVQKLAVQEHTNPTSYIARSLWRGFLQTVRQMQPIRVPKTKPMLTLAATLTIDTPAKIVVDLVTLIDETTLAPRLKTIFRLRYFGHTIGEIAAQMDISASTVARDLKKAEGDLKRCLLTRTE